VADLLFPVFGAPDWALRIFVIVLLLGLPVALLFAWAFELTPEGVKREKDIDRGVSMKRSTGRKLDRLIIVALVIALGYFIWERQAGIDPAEPVAQPGHEADPAAELLADVPEKRSIAVLPFVNMSADPENEYFADGLSEELLNQLAQIPDLQVAGRTSSFSFKGKNEDLRVIGAMLNVGNVLEGSVRRQGDKIRVTAQLIRVEDGFHLWSTTYDRTMDDVFVIQDDIATNVANSLKIVLDDESWRRMQKAGVRNVDAFIEFQKGRELFNLAHGGSDLMVELREGIVHFDRAIELFPEFGAAYWQKSDYYAHVIIDSSSNDKERADALRELRAVLDIAYRLSDDASRRAMIDFDRVLFSDDWTPMRDRIEKALAIRGCPEPTWIELASAVGYAEPAMAMWQHLGECEPMSTTVPLKLADVFMLSGQPEEALSILEDAEIRLGANAWISGTRQTALLIQGRSEEALALAPEVLSDTEFFGMSAEALPLARSGEVEAARRAMERWKSRYGGNLSSEIQINAAIGDRAAANRAAAELDARPGGPMLLMIASQYCWCGAPFDIDATPNFRERLREAGLAWPLETLIHYPAKDW
jgi:adenylate cyclase